MPWLDTWAQLQRTVGRTERHDFLDRFIRRVQRDPRAHQAELVFLLVVFDPVRGSAIKALREVRFREPTDFGAIPRQRREEARMLAEVERNELDRAPPRRCWRRSPATRPRGPSGCSPGSRTPSVTGCSTSCAPSCTARTRCGIAGAEIAAVQNTLHDLDELEAPAMAADSPQRREVRRASRSAPTCRRWPATTPSTTRSATRAGARSGVSRHAN